MACLTSLVPALKTKMRRLFLVCVILISLVSSCDEEKKANAEPKPTSEPIPDLAFEESGSIDAYFDSLAQHGKFNGVYLFARNDSIHTRSIGLKRLRKKEDSLNLQDVFQLASLTKSISAVILLMCLEENNISLDTAVQNIIPDFPYPEITTRQLLAHRSGLGNYMYLTDSLWNNPDSFMLNRDFYEFLRCEQVPLYFSPDRTFDYCNTNFAMIPIMVEALSGLPFEEYAYANLFEPLGMLSTHFMNPFTQNSEEYDVIGHYPNGKEKLAFYLDGIVGDKGLVSSVFDLYRFYLEMKSPTVIGSEYLDEAFQPHSRTKSGNFYGLGWRLRPMEQDTIIFHNGWWRGFRSYFWMSKEEDKVVIVLTNATRGGYLNQNEVWSLF